MGASGSRCLGGASVIPPTGFASPKNGLTDSLPGPSPSEASVFPRCSGM